MPSDPISIATPSLDHLTKLDYESIYDPAGQSSAPAPLRRDSSSPFSLLPPLVLAEDSFILLDALELDVLELRAGPSGRVCVEIGSVRLSREGEKVFSSVGLTSTLSSISRSPGQAQGSSRALLEVY